MSIDIVTGENKDPRAQGQQKRDLTFRSATQAATNSATFQQSQIPLAGRLAELEQQQAEQPPTPVLGDSVSAVPASMDNPRLMSNNPWNTLPPGWQPTPDTTRWQTVPSPIDPNMPRQDFDTGVEPLFRQPQNDLVPWGLTTEVREGLSQSYQQSADYRRQLRWDVANTPVAQPDPTDPRVPTSTSPYFDEGTWARQMSERMENMEANRGQDGWNIGEQVSAVGGIVRAYLQDIFRADDGRIDSASDLLDVGRNLLLQPWVRASLDWGDGKTVQQRMQENMPNLSRQVPRALESLANTQQANNGEALYAPSQGYFGEYGRGPAGAALNFLALPGQLAAASLYSVADLSRYLVGGEQALYGDPAAYREYMYRFRQALTGQDLGFTNFRDGSGNRYLAAIDPNASTDVQILQGAVGFLGDLATFGWVDDAVGNSVGTVRLAAEGVRRTGNITQGLELARRFSNIQSASQPAIRSAAQELLQAPTVGDEAVDTIEVPRIPMMPGQPWMRQYPNPPTIPQIPSGRPEIPLLTAPNQVDTSTLQSYGRALGDLESQLDSVHTSMRNHQVILETMPQYTRGHIADEVANIENQTGAIVQPSRIVPTDHLAVQRANADASAYLTAPGQNQNDLVELMADPTRYRSLYPRIRDRVEGSNIGRMNSEYAAQSRILREHPLLTKDPASDKYLLYASEDGRFVSTLEPKREGGTSIDFAIDGQVVRANVDESVPTMQYIREFRTKVDEFKQHPASAGLKLHAVTAAGDTDEFITKFKFYQGAGMDRATKARMDDMGNIVEEDLDMEQLLTDVSNGDLDYNNILLRKDIAPNAVVPTVKTTGERWYHGTKNLAINGINPMTGSSSNELGVGLYLTDKPELAKLYSQMGRNTTQAQPGTRRISDSGRVFEVETSARRLLNVNQKPERMIRDAFKAAFRETWNDPAMDKAYLGLIRNANIDEMWLAARRAWGRTYNHPMSEMEYQAFSRNVAQRLQQQGWEGLEHNSEYMGRNLVLFPDSNGNLPLQVTSVEEGIGTGTLAEARQARLRADVLLHAHYGNDVTKAWVLESQLAVEADLFEKLWKGWETALSEGKISAEQIVNMEKAVRDSVYAASEAQLAAIKRTAVDDAAKELGEKLTNLDNLCM